MSFFGLIVGIGIGMFLFYKPNQIQSDRVSNMITQSPTISFNNCTFCGNHKDNVKTLIVGATASICNDCVELCEDLIMAQNIEKLDK